MKNILFIFIVGFLICTSFNKSPIDYRDIYMGNYSCKFYYNHLTSPDMLNVLDTGRITISIQKDVVDSVVQINLGQQILKAKLIGKVLQPISQKEHYGGKFFSADSISFNFSPSMTMSLRYLGKKI